MNEMDKLTLEEEEQKSKEKYGRLWTYFLLFSVLLFFCVFGVTYTFYKGDDNPNQGIETGNILFGYSDVNQAGNGINLKNAIATSDQLGMKMMGNGQYFDFYVTASTSTANIKYKLLLKKDVDSTLSDDQIRIYLTQVVGNYEEAIIIDDFSNLKQETINNTKYYVLYEKKLEQGLENYMDSFRYRMWVKENAKDYNNKLFATKIDVYAYQVEE